MEEHIYRIIKALDNDPNCEDLKETSKRLAKIYEEFFMGMNYTDMQITKIVLYFFK
ncbi:MAG: GTP cyclohydrolase I [Thomasclavelia spiroformis]|uniref:GTP cyclohydrolase I n=1 Tax=Thomasclavelia spiroformis TaxID=29348 RepID=UPI003990D79B